ncbi:MarR family winged helix-turn-helix transcriptional regulator [Pseudohongiella spirulinae]|uniref:MarR family transcriptional regulator n=1 Tax=Pseudohongiella spirulinae TaxID=1249552 RepID=A0A0S2KFX5_9GAMM|nr:MarR family winged helix-turn-helix transcriptional regulator [Pseudohongiella spirulinae]ALO47239.1 MarR family transcriptional regulator [Pseudohongiella spirulinae]
MHYPKRKLFLDLVRAVFRLNGLLLADGDRMAERVGLTSARWKVIGIVALSRNGVTVPAIARALGQSRQAVQRITDVMSSDDLIEYAENPRHKRSSLVKLTEHGQEVYISLRAVQDPWAIGLTDDVPAAELETALRLMQRLINRME